MWGLFLGMLIGGLQILAVNKLGRMMFEGRMPEKIIGFTLFLLKIGAIVAILYLIATVSLAHLVWTAGGILLGLTAVSIYMLKRRRRAAVKAGVNGDDGGNV
jgi:hypothetical protein